MPVNIPLNIDFNDLSLSPSEAQSSLEEKGVCIQLAEARVDLHKELPPPQVFLEIMDEAGKGSVVGTMGNFSLLIGKAKSRKTFLIGVFLAATLKKKLPEFNMQACLPDNQYTVLYFDTEQGSYHVQQAAKRVTELTKGEGLSNFITYCLRKYAPGERLKMIEHAIYNTPNLGFVVIDGVRDLICSINSEEEATMLSSKLLKWTEEKNIHIMCVLHQNKGDNNARGHLGTELQNKAESVLSVSKDGKNTSISLVAPEFCRGKDFEAFAFGIDEVGLPELVEGWSPEKQQQKSAAFSIDSLPAKFHIAVLTEVFEDEPKIRYTELFKRLQAVLAKRGYKVGNNKAKEFLKLYIESGQISQEGKQGTKYAFYKLANPPV